MAAHSVIAAAIDGIPPTQGPPRWVGRLYPAPSGGRVAVRREAAPFSDGPISACARVHCIMPCMPVVLTSSRLCHRHRPPHSASTTTPLTTTPLKTTPRRGLREKKRRRGTRRGGRRVRIVFVPDPPSSAGRTKAPVDARPGREKVEPASSLSRRPASSRRPRLRRSSLRGPRTQLARFRQLMDAKRLQ